MKVAVIGSRKLEIGELKGYLPPDVTEIVSGGARGVDLAAAEYAKKNGIPLKEFLPDYPRFGKAAPLKRNQQIIEYADTVLAFWDGKSRGTKYVINYCGKVGKPIKVWVFCGQQYQGCCALRKA